MRLAGGHSTPALKKNMCNFLTQEWDCKVLASTPHSFLNEANDFSSSLLCMAGMCILIIPEKGRFLQGWSCPLFIHLM